MIPDQEQNQTEEYDMSGTVGTDTAGILALLADTSRAGRGNMYGGGEGGNGGFAPWAGPAANAQRIIGVENTVNQQASCINGTLESLTRTLAADATNKNIADGFSHACDKAEAVAVRSTTQINELERRVGDQNAAIIAQMHRDEIVNLQKFCDIEKTQATDKGELLASMQALSKEGIVRDLDRAERRVERLELQNACGCGCKDSHHGRG